MTRADETEVVETVTAALFDAVNDFDEACRPGTVSDKSLCCSARGLSGHQVLTGPEFNSRPRWLVGACRSTKCIF